MRMMMMTMTIKTTTTARTLQEGTTARKIPATDPAKKNVKQLVMRIKFANHVFFSRPSLYRISVNVLLLQQGFYVLSKTNILELKFVHTQNMFLLYHILQQVEFIQILQ